jgi:hypothetical protein
MKKAIWLRVVNLLLGLVFVVQALDVLILIFHIPVADRHTMMSIHKPAGALLLGLICLHLFLNRGWIRSAFGGKRSS